MNEFLIIAAVVIAATALDELEVTSTSEFPYQVSIQLNNTHHCGGSIISDQFVLTAAACAINDVYSQYSIRAGSVAHNYNGSIHQIDQIIKHEQFKIIDNIPLHDIALFRVSTPFIFDGTRDAIPLLLNQPVRIGSTGKISGWGKINSTFPIQLQKGTVVIEDVGICNSKYYEGRIPEGQLCAYSIDKNPCDTDAGGPLVVGLHLAGIISWNKLCGQDGYPSLYTDIYTYKDWIASHIRPNASSSADEYTPYGRFYDWQNLQFGPISPRFYIPNSGSILSRQSWYWHCTGIILLTYWLK